MKKLFIILILFSLFFLTSCKKFEDNNGPDDYTPCVITDYEIIHGMNTTHVGSIIFSSKGVTTFKCKVLNGVENIYKFDPKGKTVSIKTDFKVTKGNAKMVLLKDKEILYTFKTNDEDLYTISLAEGNYKIRVAGESAEIELKVSVE